MTRAKKTQELRESADDFFSKVFVDVAADPGRAGKTADLLGPRLMKPIPGWPEPNRSMKRIGDRQSTQAWLAVQRAADVLSIATISTGFSQYPDARLDFSQGDAPDFAPLLTTCLDGVIYGGLVRVVSHAHSRFTRSRELTTDGETVRVDLYPGDDGVALMERANQFLFTESVLWDLARRDGGFEGSVPYPVRYESARYLWTSRIAGVAFCLRCGDAVRYQRAGRSNSRLAPVCGRCIRGGSLLPWPKHAVMPDARGKWWLMCKYPNCANAFVGAGQACFCDEHRSARLAKNKRAHCV